MPSATEAAPEHEAEQPRQLCRMQETQLVHLQARLRKGKERKGKEGKGGERKGKRKGKERKGKERKGKERKGKDTSFGVELMGSQEVYRPAQTETCFCLADRLG